MSAKALEHKLINYLLRFLFVISVSMVLVPMKQMSLDRWK